MKKTITLGTIALLGSLAMPSLAASDAGIISKEQAIKAALSSLNVEVLGIRHDKPDTQWDVFVRQGNKAYEVEVNALTGAIVAVEEETLAEIQSELSGDLSHEGTLGDID